MGNACAGKKKDTQKNGSNLAKIEGKKKKNRKKEKNRKKKEKNRKKEEKT